MKYYTEDHIWVEIRGDEATVGISQYIIDEFGDVHGLELPPEDEDVIVGDDIGLIEFAAEEITIYSPLSGTIVSVNDDLENSSVIADCALFGMPVSYSKSIRQSK